MENNNKKNEKKRRKLRTLILLLFLTIIMFGTSTYAWFTANQTVTIQSINVHVETSDGIKISTNGSTWKSIIKLLITLSQIHWTLFLQMVQ